MKNLLVRFIREEEGQDIIEYALLAAFISVVAIAAINAVGGQVTAIYGEVNTDLAGRP
jgi:pilus assembly protein Flp/PilA